jgi:heme-degrading monooxygenase HmoA
MHENDIRFAPRPEPPYHVALFTSRHSGDPEIYQRLATVVFHSATRHPGFIGVEYGRDETRFGLSAFYWQDRASLDSWREALERKLQQVEAEVAAAHFKDRYVLRIMQVVDQEEAGPSGWSS